MPKFHRLLIASVFAVGSHSAWSQDKSDYFGQAPEVTTSAPAPVAQPKRVSITNQSRVDERRRDAAADAVGRRGAAAQDSYATDAAADYRNDVGTDSSASIDPSRASSVGRTRAPVTNEFQKFIADSTGTILPVFGAGFFANAPSTFAPIGDAPVPADYTLGVGDELLIRGWGSIDIDFRAKVDRNGLISIPTVGSIVLAGVRAGDAEAVIRGAVGRLYKGVTINVNFGQLRAITIYVVGQAKRPGTYTVSSLSTLVTAVFASGGPNVNGSMRRIQVKRGGAIAAELDLYGFIAKGDKSADIKLRDGDTVVIPPATGYVALLGKVNTPAIYELRGVNDSVASLLEFAGGMPVVADPRRAFLERIDANKSQPRSVEQFALDPDGLRRTLKNGDVVNVTSITPDFSNAVVLRGNVDQPIRAPFRPGMRISDLIPNRDFLITRESVKRQNNALTTGTEEVRPGESVETIAARIGGLVDEINWDYAVVERLNRTDLSASLIPFNLGKVFSQPNGPDNIVLMPGDTVTIFSQRDVAVPMEKRRVFVRIEGEVNIPGVYQMTSGETLQTLMAKAGGATPNAYLFGTAFYREQTRREQEANLERAVIRLETQLRSAQSRSVANVKSTDESAEVKAAVELTAGREAIARMRSLKPTGRIAFGIGPKEVSFNRLPRLKLENGDRLVVPPRADFVHVFGAVNAEMSPLWRPNGRVNDYLQLAGLTADADKENMFILRVDGSVVSNSSRGWAFGGFGGVEVMPGDSIVVPEKFDKETGWTKFMKGTREWAQIFANFGLGAAAIQTLRN